MNLFETCRCGFCKTSKESVICLTIFLLHQRAVFLHGYFSSITSNVSAWRSSVRENIWKMEMVFFLNSNDRFDLLAGSLAVVVFFFFQPERHFYWHRFNFFNWSIARGDNLSARREIVIQLFFFDGWTHSSTISGKYQFLINEGRIPISAKNQISTRKCTGVGLRLWYLQRKRDGYAASFYRWRRFETQRYWTWYEATMRRMTVTYLTTNDLKRI